MTTPRDDIAGLSERLKAWGSSDACFLIDHIRTEMQEGCIKAATQLDALLKERDALQARVKELEENITEIPQLLRKANARALRAEQERDEAYERAAKVADRLASDRRKRELDAGFSPATARPAAQAYWCEEIGDAIRRLAGPEKEEKE